MKKEFVSLTTVAMEKEKKQVFAYHNNGCYKQKMFHLKLESYTTIDLHYHWKTGLVGLVQVEIVCSNLKNVHSEKKCVKDFSI